MAVSKELKAYINRKYDEQVAVIEQAKKQNLMAFTDNHRANMKDRATVVTGLAVSVLQEQIAQLEKEGYAVSYDGRDFLKQGIFNLVLLPNSGSTASIEKIYDRKMGELRIEQERLLIIISLEKDFDKINMLLKDYNISI
jgi:hypothetical protein